MIFTFILAIISVESFLHLTIVRFYETSELPVSKLLGRLKHFNSFHSEDIKLVFYYSSTVTLACRSGKFIFIRSKTSTSSQIQPRDAVHDDGLPVDGLHPRAHGFPVSRCTRRQSVIAGKDGFNTVQHTGAEENCDERCELWTVSHPGGWLARQKPYRDTLAFRFTFPTSYSSLNLRNISLKPFSLSRKLAQTC